MIQTHTGHMRETLRLVVATSLSGSCASFSFTENWEQNTITCKTRWVLIKATPMGKFSHQAKERLGVHPWHEKPGLWWQL